MTVSSVDEAVKRIEAAFWRRYDANPDLQRKLAGKDRVIQLDVTDGQGHVFHVEDGKLHKVEPGRAAKPDIVISISTSDLLALFNGQLKAMQAYLSGRVKVKAAFSDILFAKSLLGW